MIIETLAAYYVTAATAVIGWVGFLCQRIDKRRETEARKAAELNGAKAHSELTEIKRRSLELSPYLRFSHRRFEGVRVESSHGKDIWLSAGHANLLCFMRDKVGRELKEGQAVVLSLENEGQRAVEVSVSVNGTPAQLNEAINEPDLLLLTYPYRANQHGKEEIVSMRFLASNGLRDEHRYLTKHGCAFFTRIDPA